MEAILLEREALRLPEGQCALLADRLPQSLEESESHELTAWAAEVESRLDAWERGEIPASDGPAAVARIRLGLR